VRGGGTVLVVLTSPGRAVALAAVAGSTACDALETASRTDLMLREIAFDHPLFAPFAAAQFNDFTKIHFWKHRRVDPTALGESRVLARFEDGDVALLEKVVEKGRLFVMTSGWHPADSQFARSSKFVPFLTAMLESGAPRHSIATNYLVHDRVPLPSALDSSPRPVVHTPDGQVVLSTGNQPFYETDQPGVYTVDISGESRSFAVNLDPLESKTSPLPVETLEQFGCRLVNRSHKASDSELERQMRNAELESRQRLWRWLILAATLVLISETWLAGRRSRHRLARAEALTT
jgi:hypothetical protein